MPGRAPRVLRRRTGDRRLLEEGADDGVPRLVAETDRRARVAHVGAPAGRDLERLRVGVGVPELRGVGLEERDGLLAEGLLDAVDVERRRERAADLAQAVEEAVASRAPAAGAART